MYMQTALKVRNKKSHFLHAWVSQERVDQFFPDFIFALGNTKEKLQPQNLILMEGVNKLFGLPLYLCS